MKTCDYPGCDEPGARHLMRRHFCNDHRAEIIRREPDDLYQYVQEIAEP